MRKDITVGEYMKRRRKTEIALRTILFMLIAAIASLFILAIYTGNYDFLVTGILLFFPVVIYSIVYADRNVPFLKNRKWLNKIGLEHIADDMQLSEPITLKSKIYCGEKVIFAKKFGVIVPYDQIAWMYRYQRRVNGITVEKYISLHTKSGKKIPIYTKLKEFEENEKIVFEHVIKKCPNLLIGYGKEQKQDYKRVVKGYKRECK